MENVILCAEIFLTFGSLVIFVMLVKQFQIAYQIAIFLALFALSATFEGVISVIRLFAYMYVVATAVFLAMQSVNLIVFLAKRGWSRLFRKQD